jgi:hypothetical protein
MPRNYQRGGEQASQADDFYSDVDESFDAHFFLNSAAMECSSMATHVPSAQEMTMQTTQKAR